jgi:protocatechuate 3,4-dioxygenase beta subunit
VRYRFVCVTPHIDRRRFLVAGLGLPAAAFLAGCEDNEKTAAQRQATSPGDTSLQPTPACTDDDDDVTPSQAEGPYFTPDSPLRRSLLEPGMDGQRLRVTGRVLDTGCRPIPRAILDFWQADADGEYDNEGFRLRGHQRADSAGRFRLDSVVPGVYPGRTRHLHVKVARPSSSEVLTTQLYFPGERQNASDGIFDEALLMRVSRSGARRLGRFTFVLT